MLDFIEDQLFKKVLPSVSYLRLDGAVPVARVSRLVRRVDFHSVLFPFLNLTRIAYR